jgi:hypothetical protein
MATARMTTLKSRGPFSVRSLAPHQPRPSNNWIPPRWRGRPRLGHAVVTSQASRAPCPLPGGRQGSIFGIIFGPPSCSPASERTVLQLSATRNIAAAASSGLSFRAPAEDHIKMRGGAWAVLAAKQSWRQLSWMLSRRCVKCTFGNERSHAALGRVSSYVGGRRIGEVILISHAA